MSVIDKIHNLDRVEVHTPGILEEITTDSAKNESCYGSSWHRPYYMSAPMPKSASPSMSCDRLSSRRSGRYPSCRFQSWLNEDFVRDIQEKSDDSRSIRNICTAVLDNENTIAKDIDKYLEYTDISNKNRKQMLFKKWSERVYTPLKEKIDEEMDSTNFKDYAKRKRDLYQKYLDYQNRKGMVFLDVYSQEEYDPLQLSNPRPGPLKASVHHSLDKNDPLCFQDFKRIAEEQESLRCKTGQKTKPSDIRKYYLPAEPLVPLGRQKTTCKTWLRMPIHDIDSPPRLKSRQKMRCTTNHSQIGFNQWQSTSSLKLVDLELHSQKKRYYPEKYAGRQILEWPEVPEPYRAQETTALTTQVA